MGKLNKAIVYAYDRGYRVREDGSVAGLQTGTLATFPVNGRYVGFGVKPPGYKYKVQIKVHRLCAYQKYGAFWEDGLEVDHINGDTFDNRPSNIRVVTRAENIRNAHSPFGWEDILEIRERYTGAWGQQTELAEEYGVSTACISGIVNNRTWAE